MTSSYKPRWWQFSLRSLGVMIGAFALLLALLTSRFLAQHRAVGAIRSAGGTVYYDYQFSASPKVPGQEPTAAWLRGLLTDDLFHDVFFADLRGVQTLDVNTVLPLKGLQVLVLEPRHLDESQIKLLSTLPHLELVEIDVPHTELLLWQTRVRATLPKCRVSATMLR